MLQDQSFKNGSVINRGLLPQSLDEEMGRNTAAIVEILPLSDGLIKLFT